ncbi:MAG TPA: hypothetical protein VGF92_08150 [Stellaceae bacterium]|jgi:hypothetical protein
MSFRAAAITLSALIALQACTKSPPDAQQPKAGDTASTLSRDLALSFVPPGDAYDALTKPNYVPPFVPTSVPNKSNLLPKRDASIETLARFDSDNKVWEACGGRAPVTKKGQQQRILPALIPMAGWGIGETATWSVGTADSDLQNDVRSYSVARTVESGPFDFYDVLSNGKGFHGQPAAACFRLTQRGLAAPDDAASASTLYMDLIGQISYDPRRPQIITIKPVRLFYMRDLTASSDGRVAIDVKLAANMVWLSETGAMSTDDAINKSVVAATLNVKNLSGTSYFYNVYDLDKIPAVEAPLPSFDFSSSPHPNRHDRMRLTATVTEVGNVPWLLKNSAKLVDQNKDGVTKDLVDLGDKYTRAAKSVPPSKTP